MIVKQIIDKWDPIDLLPFAPNDEYDSESKEIENYLLTNIHNINADNFAKKIMDVFCKSFGNDIFEKNIDECREIAILIIDRYVNESER